MPPDAPALPHILQGLDADDDWDTSNNIEKGYKMAGLKRYGFAKMATYIQHKHKKSKVETTEAKSDSKRSSSSFNESGLGSTKKKDLKLEYAEWDKLQQVIKNMKIHKGFVFFVK
jgi:macrodomain Ter protein organizer (MatP/YcbG family)